MEFFNVAISLVVLATIFAGIVLFKKGGTVGNNLIPLFSLVFFVSGFDRVFDF